MCIRAFPVGRTTEKPTRVSSGSCYLIGRHATPKAKSKTATTPRWWGIFDKLFRREARARCQLYRDLIHHGVVFPPFILGVVAVGNSCQHVPHYRERREISAILYFYVLVQFLHRFGFPAPHPLLDKWIEVQFVHFRWKRIWRGTFATLFVAIRRK